MKETIGFIGFGHMAQVIFQALRHAHLFPSSQVFFTQKNREKQAQNERKWGIQALSLEEMVGRCDHLLLCVRPKQAAEVLHDLSSFSLENKKIISILAGVPLSFFQRAFQGKGELARVMPNIASAVQEGMSILSFPPQTKRSFQGFTARLFSSMGKVLEVPETFMDAACAMAGSGPGFVFCLIEAMARFGEREGLSYQEALQVASQVFLGASRLIQEGALPKDLIQQIATPGGTTEAGFLEMQKTHIEAHFQQVLEAAQKRSSALRL